MNRRIRKLMTWTISDLSRLMSPPSWPPSPAAAHAAAGPTSASATPRHTKTTIPLRSCRRIRRSPRSRDARRRFVKTITQSRPVSIVRGARRSGRVRDDPAPDHDVAVVEDDRLARAGRPLRRIEHHLRPVSLEGAHGRRGRAVAVADLRLDPQRCPRWLARDEVHRLGHDAVAVEVPRLAHPDGVALGVEIDDVERAAGRETEASPLADGVGRDP